MRKIFVMTEKLWNLLLHLQALIATHPQAGKSSPVVASILEKNVEEQPRELLFVRLQITVRTARGVNCPYEQVLCSHLASGLGVYVECMSLKEDTRVPARSFGMRTIPASTPTRCAPARPPAAGAVCTGMAAGLCLTFQ